jgi:hypothetical protein
MASNPASIPNPAKVAEEQAACFEWKRKGLSVRAISQRVGLPRSTVQDRLDSAYSELVMPVAAEVRLLELERLDSWLARLEELLDNGEDPCRVIPVAVRVSERRARFLGLDAPVQVDARGELRITVESVDLEKLK